jgi:hypothetical protein
MYICSLSLLAKVSFFFRVVEMCTYVGSASRMLLFLHLFAS